MGINRVNLSGNLTRDPELRTTQGGTAILAFGIAVNDRVRNRQTGEWEDYPNYVDVTVFGNRAEPLSRMLSKGQKVALEGRLRYSSWEDRQSGQKRSKLEVIVDEIEFMSQRQQGQQPAQPQYQQQPTYQQPAQPQYQQQPMPQVQQQADVYDEFIPF